MIILILSTFMLLFPTSSLAHAANPQLTKQIFILKQHTAFLQRAVC